MDISAELSSIQDRISSITGIAQNDVIAPSASGQPGYGSRYGSTALEPASDPNAAKRFADMVSQALGSIGTGSKAMPPAQIEPLITQNAQTYGVDPALIKAVIANESGFNPHATSPVGAQGLMQLMPGTAAGLGVSDSYNAAQNVAGGTRYLRGLYDRFGDWHLAVAAYNAGPGAVQKYGGVPPYAETAQLCCERL